MSQNQIQAQAYKKAASLTGFLTAAELPSLKRYETLCFLTGAFLLAGFALSFLGRMGRPKKSTAIWSTQKLIRLEMTNR